MIIKNTYGVSVAFSTSKFGKVPKEEFSGSALQRKKQVKKPKEKTVSPENKIKEKKLRSMSRRTKQKKHNWRRTNKVRRQGTESSC